MSTTHKFETAVVWLDGISLLGLIEELEFPGVTWETADQETIGLRGVSEYPSRVEAMEMSLTWASYTQDLAVAAADPWTARTLQVRSNYGQYTGGSKVADILQTVTLSGRFKSNPVGSLSQGTFERESMMAVDYVKEVWNGQLVFEFGVNPPIYRIGAGNTDLFAQLRANLGI